jgi:glutamate transport system substrate-binding protein
MAHRRQHNVKRNRTTKILAVAMGLLLLTAACGDDDDGTTTEDTDAESTDPSFEAGTTMARVLEAGSIKIGVKYDQPGFGLRNPTSGDVEGFDVEIAKLIVEGIGPDVEIEFVESVSANRETFIQDGTVDLVIATYTINDARKQVVDFAGPYFVAQQDIMVAADDDSITEVGDLNGKRVCSVQGSTSEKNVRAAAPEAELSLFPGYSDCASELRDGRVDAVTTDNAILAGLVQDSDGAFKLVEAPFTEEPYGIGLKKDDDGWRDFINDRLEEIYESGEWADAFEATLGAIGLDTPEPPEVNRYTETPPAPSTTTTAAP